LENSWFEVKRGNYMTKIKLGGARSPNGFGVFRSHETDWAFKRTLEFMNEKSAEIGECLYAARQIDEKDGESWIKEWADLAERVQALALGSLQKGHKISAREAFLRATNYYRTAEYGCVPSHPSFHELWEKSVNCFQQACRLFIPPIQIIEVPFEGKGFPGYFWRPDHSNIMRPTLIAVGGNDSSGEEVFLSTGLAAIRRGYNFFTFEYPGHRGTVHLYPDCVKRPDPEIPFTAAFDLLETLPGVDERIALTGFSYGGYVVSRVAIHEKRLQAVIPNSPLIDIPRAVLQGILGPLVKGVPGNLLDKVIDWRTRRSPLMRSLLYYSKWTWGFDTFQEEFESEAFRAHVIAGDLQKITCAALALVSEDEGEEMIKQAQEFYEGISSRIKKIHTFTLEKDGSNDHCQLDNFARAHQVAFDWLDDLFRYYGGNQ
jgi:pimeloyl-ACP methyl ester carboxylesterase